MQHKSAITLLLTMILPALLFAEPVGLLRARRQAEAVVGKPMTRMQLSTTRAVDEPEPLYYIFSGEDGRGFCFVATNDTLPPILGYSHDSRVTSVGKMPDALKWYLQNISSLEKGRTFLHPVMLPSEVAPLCPSQWGQDKPFNYLCPKKNGQFCPTGCVATALAQIMYRWQWPMQGQGYSWAKDGNGETYSGTLEHTYNWTAMRASTGENLVDSIAADAVATLLYDCGLSVNMNYNTDGSTAITPIKALSTHFGYNPTTLRMRHRDCYTADEWMALIKNELVKGRPIFYAAASETNGGKDASGHAFIIDGYDVADNVHINWGWDGVWDGFFPIARMNPDSYKFSLRQRMTLGIEPARNGESGIPMEYPYIGEALKCSATTSIQKTQAFTVIVGKVGNPNANSHTWQLSMGIFDTQGQMLGEIKTGPVPSVSLESGYTSGASISISCKLKDEYPDGLYALRLLFRETGDSEWLLPDMVGGFAKNALYIRISSKRVTFNDGSEYIAVGIPDITYQNSNQTNRTDTDVTRVYDITGRLIYSAPTQFFKLGHLPARGTLIIRQGYNTQKVIL